jgi:hypothetical protein
MLSSFYNRFAFVTLLAFVTTTTSAQLTRQFNHNFMISADVKTVIVQAADSVIYEPWSSATFLMEGTVTLTNANPGILEHVVRNGRYELALEENGEMAVLKSVNPTRQAIKFKEQPVGEKVLIKIYYPDSYSISPNGSLQRNEE